MSARIIRLKPENRLRIEAPFGLVDLFALRMRPNSRRNRAHVARTSADVRVAAAQPSSDRHSSI
jgi:hypothetical protein